MVEPATAREEGDSNSVNVIDNYSDRPLVPSTNTLRQTIECMLEKGIAEGIPGPRGRVGPAGPMGEDGPPGPDGRSITRVEVVPPTPLPGQPAEALPLIPDPNNPDGLLLRLRIPQGEQGEPGTSPTPIPFNRVINASWHHDEVLGDINDPSSRRAEQILQLVNEDEAGLVVEFERPVLIRTLNNRSILLLVTSTLLVDTPWLRQEFQIPITLEPVEVEERFSITVLWRGDGDAPNALTEESFTLIQTVSSSLDNGAETTSAVRINLSPDINGGWREIFESSPPSPLLEPAALIITVVLRGDWILDEEGRPLDGNHIWPGIPGLLPDGQQLEGLPSGNGAGGGDWRSSINIADTSLLG